MNELKERFHDAIDNMMDLAQYAMDETGCPFHETLPYTEYISIEIDGVQRYIKLEVKILH